MITPYDKDENVDTGRINALVDFLLERDIDGLYLTGSTGEGFLMTSDERKNVVETVVKRVAGRKPVIVHIGDIGTRKMCIRDSSKSNEGRPEEWPEKST